MNLCCSVNPIGQCAHCRATICKEHLEELGLGRHKWDCKKCKWVCIIYSYPLRSWKSWPSKLVEVDFEDYQYSKDYARETVLYNG